MYPKQLVPNGEMEFEINGELVKIPKCAVSFEKWNGQPINNFGGKPLVCVGNKPMFAELAILQGFIADDWEARWISTYGRSKSSPIFLDDWEDNSYRNQRHHDIANGEVRQILSDIAKYNPKSYTGCWDIFGWKDGKILFAESKRKKKDNIRESQRKWLIAAFKFG